MIQEAQFIGSFPSIEKSIQTLPEFAFIGRSNVGKSSLINLITQRKDLAKVSSTPGKTQMINYFEINKHWHLVDLPGYGYAKLSKKHRASLEKMIKDYIENSSKLYCVFLLIDSSIPPQQIDIDFANYLGEKGIPFIIIFTKSDKNTKGKIQYNIEAFEKILAENWETVPQHFTTSAKNKIGQQVINEFIQQYI
ncbi:MAG: YihA family ribosome biogenesis GTP-binding protein [Chitinophagales bacterium]|nr:YihA family ribosome biogenesis GTP-binding protein [Chitinophagales bacterium]